MSGRTDPLCVDTAEFMAEVRPIRERFEQQHPCRRSEDGRPDAIISSFMGTLAERTGINVRRLHGYFRGEWPQVPLCDADEILVALDRPDIMAGLTIYRRARKADAKHYALTPLAA